MIRFFFRNRDGDIEEFTDRVNLDDQAVALTSQAEQGSVGTSTITVDDPLGDWDITGHRWLYVIEDDDTAFEMLYWGYVWDRDIKRMPPNVLQSRQWVVTVNDINTLISRRIMVGSDCNRPAETDVERMQWLAATTEQSFIDDLTFLDTTGPVDMDAVDYRYQYASQIYDDCAQASGKNYFLYPRWNGSAWECGLWYAHGDSTEYTSGLRISNDIDDVDYGVTFEAKLDTTLTRSPSRVYSGVAMPYDGGTVYHTLASTIANFAARDTSSPMVNVKTNAKASARSFRYLHTIKTEEDIIETGTYLPSDQVNGVLAGQRIEAKFTHLPGYEDFTFMRVLKKTTTLLTPRVYEIDLTLSAQPGAVASPSFLIAFASGADVQLEDLSDHPWTLEYWSGDICDPQRVFCGAGPPVHQAIAIYSRAIEAGETTTVGTFKPVSGSPGGVWVYQIAGADRTGLAVVDDVNTLLVDGGTASVSVTAANESVLFGQVGFAKVNYDNGWWAGGLYASDIVTPVDGTELVNASTRNDGSESWCPWDWIGYTTGIGTLSVSANANAHGAGSGAYSCGWNIGKAGLLIPTPTTFSIVQSAFGGEGLSGASFDVVLGSPPTP